MDLILYPIDYVEYGEQLHKYLFSAHIDTIADSLHPVVGNYAFTRFRDVFFVPLYFAIVGGFGAYWFY